MPEFCDVEKDGKISIITINRPKVMNALHPAANRELGEVFDDFCADPSQWIAIITGAGERAFSAGNDLKHTAAGGGEVEMMPRGFGGLTSRFDNDKPIIAAVSGPALAGGAGLALASDIVIAAPEAKFGLPEPRRGIVAGLVAPLLAFRVGGGQAARLLLSAELIDAGEAHRIGLYHEIVKSDLIWARAHEIAKECAKGAPEALQLTKRMLNETIGESLTTMISAGAAVSATARTTAAATEGLAAFFEKREADWQ